MEGQTFCVGGSYLLAELGTRSRQCYVRQSGGWLDSATARCVRLLRALCLFWQTPPPKSSVRRHRVGKGQQLIFLVLMCYIASCRCVRNRCSR